MEFLPHNVLARTPDVLVSGQLNSCCDSVSMGSAVGFWWAGHDSCLNVINMVDLPMLRTAEEAEQRYLRATPLLPTEGP
jgi:hypothetical protein